MFSLRVIVGLLLVVWSTASSVVFEESPSTSNDNTNVGTRNGPFDDSVVIEAAGSPSGGDVDSRFFGLLGGGNRPFGGGGFGGGHPIGATKPGRCPGLLGLGLGQPEGGYGGFGGYGGYPGGYGGYPGGYGGYPGGYGGYPGGYGGYGNHHPHHGAGGYGYPGQYGYGGGYNGGFGKNKDSEALIKEVKVEIRQSVARDPTRLTRKLLGETLLSKDVLVERPILVSLVPSVAF